ncbi:MAG: hypothetical protein K6A40_00630 [Solobacterium sp.]|nr:hypothetical protein [Solobacterium sp.]
MRELINDPFYEMIKNYPDCLIDYCLIGDAALYQGYRSHKDAVLFAMLKVIERYIERQLRSELEYRRKIGDEPFPWNLDIGKASAAQITSSELLHLPEILGKDRNGNTVYDCKLPDPLEGDQIPYWYAFWETLHTSGYGPDEFRRVNAVLFPGGGENLEVWQWTTDWSNYFEAGHEWWGTACWSVYDPDLKRYAVIMASATD